MKWYKNVYVVMLSLILFGATSVIAGACDDDPTIIAMNDVNKTLEQISAKEYEKLEEVIKRGNDFIIGYYVGGVHEAAARWWYQRYNEDDGVPLGTVTDKTSWWYSDNVAISGQRIHQILNFKSVMDGNLPSGCPNIHLASISENKTGIALRYEFLVVGTFYNQEERFNTEHHGEIWSIELSFNQENQLDDIRFLVGSDIQACKYGLSQARFTLNGEEDKRNRPKWLTQERYIAVTKAVEEMQQASSICSNY